MKDKLISAKHFIKSIQLLLSRSSLGEISPQTELTVGEIATLVENEPAAFDKEKVKAVLHAKADHANDKWMDKSADERSFYWDGKEDGFR